MPDRGDDGRVRGEDGFRDPLSVECLEVRIAPTATADDNRVDVLRVVEMVDAVRDGRRRVRPLDGGVLHQNVNGGVMSVDRVLDVVPGVTSKRRDDADPLRERRRLLFLLVVEPATLFEFASQSLNGGRLVAVAAAAAAFPLFLEVALEAVVERRRKRSVRHSPALHRPAGPVSVPLPRGSAVVRRLQHSCFTDGVGVIQSGG